MPIADFQVQFLVYNYITITIRMLLYNSQTFDFKIGNTYLKSATHVSIFIIISITNVTGIFAVGKH